MVVVVLLPEDLPSLSTDVQPIFSASCAACHGERNPAMGLRLVPARTYHTTVNVRSVELSSTDRIVPYYPRRSYLLLEFEGAAHDTTGVFRAHAGVTFTARELAIIRSWIRAGAPNN